MEEHYNKYGTHQEERSSLEKKYKHKIIEELQLGPHLKYTGNKDVPFLNIYRYEEAFSFTLACKLLTRLKASNHDYVFDPFCGSGTTLYASTLKGVPSVGVDSLPVACFVSKTLPTFLLLSPGEIKRIWKNVSPDIKTCEPAPIASDIPVMKTAFKKSTLVTLRKMKTAITQLAEPYRNIFLVLLFSILEECSSTVKVHRYLKVAPHKSADPIEAVARKVHTVEKGIRQMRKEQHTVCREMPDVFLKDAKTMLPFENHPTIIITSPPYADTIDYIQSYALELCFHFVENHEEFNALHDRFLRSYMESTLSRGEKAPHPAVEEVVTALTPGNVRVVDMLTAYFLDMKAVIQNWYTILSTHAQVAVVVDNLQYEGEIIPVDLVLSDMAEDAGFTVEEIVVANYKKTATPIRESILLWKK